MIGEVGYPIVVSLVAMYMLYKQHQTHTASIMDLIEKHSIQIDTLNNAHSSELKKLMTDLTIAINNNTVIINKLYERVDR